MTLRTGFLWSLIVSLAIAAALGVAALLLPVLFPRTGDILGTALIIAGASLLCLACAAAMEHGRVVPIGWIGIVCAVAAAAIWLMHIWGIGPSIAQSHRFVDALERIGGSLQTIAVWAALIAGLHIRPVTNPRLRWPKWAINGLVTVLAGFTVIGIWTELDDWWWLKVYGAVVTLIGWTIWIMLLLVIRCRRRFSRTVAGVTATFGSLLTVLALVLIWEVLDDDDVVIRLLSALIILTACGTVVVPILARLDRHAHRSSLETVSQSVKVELTCPRCGTKQSLTTGHAKCDSCGLRIEINVQEPRCTCGYPIYKLESERCPECGRTIPVSERWTSDHAERGAAISASGSNAAPQG